jgi:hypothetical protein
MSERDELEAWATVARRQRYDASPRTHEESFAHVRARLESTTRRRRAILSLGGALVAFACAWLALRTPQPISYRVQRWDGEQAVRVLDFSDGTHVALTRGSSLDVKATSSRGASLRLRHGRAALAVEPRKGASWIVQAGPYRVRVTGTAFELDWSESTQRFAITMQHGSVSVTGPQLAGGEVTLRGQESLIVRARQPRDEVPVQEPLAQQLVAKDTLQASLPTESTNSARARRGVGRDWPQRVANGDFAVVLREAERAGISSVLAAANVEELAALADAARYARRSALARRALVALQRRFPQAPPSQDAEFLLARLSEGAGALRRYQRYLEQQPNGAYATQALGRAMVLQHELGDSDGAARSAARYLRREPQGPYAATARALGSRAASSILEP